MNLSSLTRLFNQNLQKFLVITLVGFYIFAGGAPPVRAGAPIPIVDSLGAATPATKFSVFGTFGHIIGPQFRGPKFTLTQPTTITEIGGFLNNCRSFFLGIPQCPTTLPFVVQIRPALDGEPDVTVLATFELSHDNDPFIVSYESVVPNLLLPTGTYFALFGPQANDEGFLLAGANNPFEYRAGIVELGLFIPPPHISLTEHVLTEQQIAAVRILAERNVFVDGCDSGVPDMVLPGGSTISDLISECAVSATNRGRFVSCSAHVTNNLRRTGTITAQQKSAIQRCNEQDHTNHG